MNRILSNSELRTAITRTVEALRPPIMGARHPAAVDEALQEHLKFLLGIEKARADAAVVGPAKGGAA